MATTLTIHREIGEDVSAFHRACIELAELGFLPTEDLTPGDRVLWLEDFDGVVVRAQEITIGSWDQASHSRHDVWLPGLEPLLTGIQALVGPECDLDLHRFRDGTFSVGIPIWRRAGGGDSYLSAAADLLVELLRDRCPSCQTISDGRRAHDSGCPALTGEDES